MTFGGFMTFDANAILQIVSILFGAGGIASFILSVRRTKAQNTLDLSTAWEKFSTPILERIEHLDKQVQKLEKENRYLRRYVERLIRQIIQLGGTPEPYHYDQAENDEKDTRSEVS